MIDLRCQLFEGQPRGPADFADAARACRAACDEGVRSMVAVIPWPSGAIEPPLSFDECDRRLALLQAEVGDRLHLHLGFALEYAPDLPALVERHGKLLALGGASHLLVSLPALAVPAEAERVWEALAGLGFGVVIARPECSPALRRDPARLARWVASNLTLQLDAASLTGAHGREAHRSALALVKAQGAAGRVVVASNGSAGGRRVSLAAAAASLEGRFGGRVARRLTSQRPAEILGGPGDAAAAGAAKAVSRLSWAEMLLRPWRAREMQQEW